jgi:Kef-type K+ transport system membrane component KefB
MNRVLVYSLLLVAGLVGSQVIPPLLGDAWVAIGTGVRLSTMVALAFIMVHVGYEFEVDRSRPRALAVDYGVAATAAGFPWIFVSVYFVVVLAAEGSWRDFDAWKPALLAGRFAAPTSAGVLFSMLAAAGLSATWVFRKARVLAIFDDLDTVLLMIPLKMLIVGLRWQMGVVVAVMAAQLWLAWRLFRRVHWNVRWPAVMTYSVIIVAVSEAIYRGSKLIDDVVPIHIEVLLPAFVLGCLLARPQGADPHRDDAREGHQEGPEETAEQSVSSIVSAVFMVLVGLSMPALATLVTRDGPGWGTIALHVIAVTVLANLGKMFPTLVYRQEASWRERLAVSIGMWPRGEVGAGVLIISLGYGIGGPMIVVAALSLALNLVLTGVFIAVVRRLLRVQAVSTGPSVAEVSR